MQNALSLQNITFTYPTAKNSVIENFSLDIQKGSFTTLLGASGSGKTTLLRLISGFLQPASGDIIIDGKISNSLPPESRRIGMVFQDYALFPHMSVKQNLLYGLRNQKGKKVNSARMKELLEQTANALEIENLLERFPNEISGGQQQRVALGRALILEPEILLMDEPLSSLDTKLRQTVRNELRQIQKKLSITTVYVTHDQEEAMCLSDKIAVLNNGKLLQYDTPKEIYFSPKDEYTASFVGSSNFLKLEGKNFLVRPEWIEMTLKNQMPSKAPVETLDGTVVSSEFLGSKIRYTVQSAAGLVVCESGSSFAEELTAGTQVTLVLNRKHLLA